MSCNSPRLQGKGETTKAQALYEKVIATYSGSGLAAENVTGMGHYAAEAVLEELQTTTQPKKSD